MAKDKDLLTRFGANLAESMGAGRVAQTPVPTISTPSRHDGCTRLRTAAEIEISRIAPDPNQPRTEFDEDALDRLAESLKSHGQLQPISVRWDEAAGRYLIVTGERRWRAATLAGRPTIAAIIVEGERTESQILEMQLIENCLREDLKPVEQARAFRTLMDANGWPAMRLAEVLRLSPSTVTRALALLELPRAVQDHVEAGELAPSVAYEVSRLESPDEQEQIAKRIVSQGLSRADAVKTVKQSAAKRSAGKQGRAGVRKPAASKTRILRVAVGRVTIDLRKTGDTSAMLAAVREAVSLLEAEIEGQGAEAA